MVVSLLHSSSATFLTKVIVRQGSMARWSRPGQWCFGYFYLQYRTRFMVAWPRTWLGWLVVLGDPAENASFMLIGGTKY
ncbi:hypothetical protein OK016_14385 [Vibrio chagasii]|nr:hypothetical protein [Vibrio chagasii]